jgi:hypothetical protein
MTDTAVSNPRPWWMTALALFCMAAVLVNVPRDLFVPASRDVEIWLGFEVHGRAAQLTAPIHWAIFAIGAWAFWTRRRWIVPLAVAYLLYVAVSHIVWSEVSPHGRGWPIGLLQATAFTLVAFFLYRVDAKLGGS